MVGSAVVTTVASRPIMKPASEPTISVTRGRRDEAACGRAALVVMAIISSSSRAYFLFHFEDEDGPRDRTPRRGIVSGFLARPGGGQGPCAPARSARAQAPAATRRGPAWFARDGEAPRPARRATGATA